MIRTIIEIAVFMAILSALILAILSLNQPPPDLGL